MRREKNEVFIILKNDTIFSHIFKKLETSLSPTEEKYFKNCMTNGNTTIDIVLPVVV